MMTERQFWTELDRLLIQQDLLGAAQLVNDYLEDFSALLSMKYENASQMASKLH